MRTQVSKALLFSIPLCFLGIIIYFSFNAPFADDFDIYLDFLNEFNSTRDLLHKFLLLFKKHNEHFLILNRLAALSSYYFLGTINFRAILYTGLTAIPVTIFLLYKLFNFSNKIKTTFFLPLVLLICQPCYTEATMWATNAWHFFWINLIAITCFILALNSSPKKLFFSSLIYVIGVLTQGNGIIIALTLTLVYILRKQVLPALYWFLLFIGSSFLFHSTTPDITNFATLLKYTIKLTDYTLSFLGSAFAFENHFMAFSMGFCLLGIFCWNTYKQYYNANTVLYSFSFFLICSALINGLARVKLGTPLAFTTGRYMYLSVLLASVSYLSLCENSKNKTLTFTLGIFFSLTFFIFSYLYNFEQYSFRNHILKDSILTYQLFNKVLAYPIQDRGDQIFTTAITTSTYKPPQINPTPYEAVPTDSIPQIDPSKKIKLSLEKFYRSANYILLTGWAILQHQPSKNNRIYIELNNGSEQYTFTPSPRLKPDVTLTFAQNSLKKFNYDQSGFFFLLPLKALPPGQYTLKIILKTPTITTSHNTHLQISVIN